MILITIILIFLSVQLISAQTVVGQKMNDKLTPTVSAKINKYVGEKFNVFYKKRILAQDVQRFPNLIEIIGMDGTFELKTPSKRMVILRQKTDYPELGQIDIELNHQKEKKMEISLRIPTRSEKVIVTVNGVPTRSVMPGEYLIFNKKSI